MNSKKIIFWKSPTRFEYWLIELVHSLEAVELKVTGLRLVVDIIEKNNPTGIHSKCIQQISDSTLSILFHITADTYIRNS